MIIGVTEGLQSHWRLVGVGYRASNQGQKVDLALGYSHNIVLQFAPEVTLETISEKVKQLLITSFDKQLLGQVAAKN
jgi:large subunit ribosomal protein L6